MGREGRRLSSESPERSAPRGLEPPREANRARYPRAGRQRPRHPHRWGWCVARTAVSRFGSGVLHNRCRMTTYECQTCGRRFEVPQKTLDKYPSWQPKKCLRCHAATKPGAKRSAQRPGPERSARSLGTAATETTGPGRRSSVERDLTLQEVLETYSGGPDTGVFTDGAAHPNPGPGGWGAVYVVKNEIVAQARGAESPTTNNRMELTALIEGYRMVPSGTPTTVMTDSQLCVDTITRWAAGWERNGWKRKGGPIKNLELVKELYALARARPDIELRWIKSHNGFLWNEYADALATAYRRPTP